MLNASTETDSRVHYESSVVSQSHYVHCFTQKRKSFQSCCKLCKKFRLTHFYILLFVEFFLERKNLRTSTVNNQTLSLSTQQDSRVEKHRDVISIVSPPPLLHSMSAPLMSLSFGRPVPMSASLFLCLFLYFSPFSPCISSSL